MNFLIVDDHAIIRQACSSLLTEVFPHVTVTEADSGEEAWRVIPEQDFDLLILDTSLPGISGIETARRIREHKRKERILFFSMFDEPAVVRQAIDAGALGYVCKRSNPSVLIEAVRTVLNGRPFVEHELSMKLAFRGETSQHSLYSPGMTPREFEVFVLMAGGKPVVDIALHLCLSNKTVANYVTGIKSKLGVRTEAELVHKAIEMGVIRVGSTA